MLSCFFPRFIPPEERRRFQESAYPNNVFVSNLSTTTSVELKKICEQFGDVASVKVVTDDNNCPRGFGFVSFKDRRGAEKAIIDLNSLCLNGRMVSAQFAKGRTVLDM